MTAQAIPFRETETAIQQAFGFNKSNITIKNLNIRTFGFGIKFSQNHFSTEKAENCLILANDITNNTYGVWLPSSLNCYVADNYITDNTCGASLSGCSGSVFRNNRLERNQYAILDEGYSDNDLDTSNTIDGKPIYYWINQHDMTVPSDAGLVVLKNCSGIKVENLSLKGNGNGLLVCYTSDSTISGNILSANLNGIILRQSHNNVITGNQVTDNENSGIALTNSDNNKVLNNMVVANGDGVTCSDSENSVISNNQIIANERVGISAGSNCTITNNYISENSGNGIFFSNISGSLVSGNNVTLNKGCGIGFGYGPNGMIKGNYIAKNNVGIWISNAVENTIISNTVTENEGLGIRLEGSHKNNLIYHNNFIDNNNRDIQASIADVWVYPDLFKRLSPDQTPRPPQLVAGAANAWDNGIEGNYWSDYTTRYPDTQKVENQAVCNTPYYINDNNKDNHPLLAPLEISTLEQPTPSAFPSPSIEPSQESNPTPIHTVKTEPSPFPITLAVACIASVASICVCLLVYVRKYRH